MLELFTNASAVVKLVLLALVGFSITSWTLIAYKYFQFRSASRDAARVLPAFGSCDSFADLSRLVKDEPSSGPFVSLLKCAAEAQGSARHRLQGTLQRCQTAEVEKLESYLIFLATTGSTAPFIGLLGTVWGIMHAFHGIGAAGSASLAVVAPGIAEALVATAAGLAATIPAVMAYNFYLNGVRKLTNGLEGFASALQELAVKT